jgi:hypothetical protein
VFDVHVMAWGWTVVASARWPSGSGPGWFRCTGGTSGLGAQVPKPSADACRGEAVGCCRLFPEFAQVSDEATGQAELGVGGDDQSGPAVRSLRGADRGAGPSKGLLEQPEGVLEVESAQVRLPEPVDVGGGGAGG